MYCHNCGEQIAEGGTFCHKCGSQKIDSSPNMKVDETTTQIPTPVPVPTQSELQPEMEIRYAGFWVRWAALMIDSLILSVATVILILIPIIGWILASVVSFAYFVFMVNKYQDTLGKRAIGVMVVSAENYEKLTLEKVFMREVLGKIVSAITFNIGYLIAAFTKRKQALHDFVGNSVVIYRDPKKDSKVWIIVMAIFAGLFVMIAIIGILSSIVLVSLSSARGKAQDASIKASISSVVPAAILYDDEKGTYAGFKATGISLPECSGKLIANISPDGKNIAFFGKLCSEEGKYFCSDSPDMQSGVVTESYAKLGKATCE